MFVMLFCMNLGGKIRWLSGFYLFIIVTGLKEFYIGCIHVCILLLLFMDPEVSYLFIGDT